MLVWMEIRTVGIQPPIKITLLFALETTASVKVVHLKGKLHRYFSLYKQAAQLTAFILLLLSSTRKQLPSNLNSTGTVLYCYRHVFKNRVRLSLSRRS